MKRLLLLIYSFLLLTACNSKKANTPSRDTIIQQQDIQESLYQQLLQLMPESLPAADSLSVLVVPLQASCPSCMEKTLDSIVKFRKNILPRHYIVMTLNGGMKYIKQFYKNAGHSHVPNLPPGVLFIDSTNKAGTLQLYIDNPAFYYAANGHVYRKIDALPATIKEDLREFFRGYRLNTE